MSHKIAIITGGSRGLGRNAALKLAEKGVDIILTWRNKEAEALEVVKAIEALGAHGLALQLDIGGSNTFSDFASEVQKQLKTRWQRDSFDYLLNNAGSGLHEPFISTSEAQFDEMVKIHFKGPFFLTQKLLPLMANGGRILNISSGLTRFSQPGSGTYAAVKGAIEVLTRYQAKELGERGITVNVLAPGAIETDFSDGRVRDNPQINAFISSVTALGRVGLPDDIGNAIALILSEASGWINGQRIEASGGMFL